MINTTVRIAERKDLPDIIRLLAHDEMGQRREEFTDPLPQRYTDAFHIIDNDMNNHMLVICLDEQVIGYLQVTFTQYLSHKGSKRATIENVRVDEKYRCQGIGSKLMRYAIELAKNNGCSIVQLTTDRSRTDAHRFYERLGFRATHEGMKLAFD